MTSKLIVNSIRHTGASADAITLDASGNVTFPANATCSGTATGFGKVLQVVTVLKTDSFSTSVQANSSADVTGLSVNITPSSASNKIMVFASIDCFTERTNTYNAMGHLYLIRDTTRISGKTIRTRIDNSLTTNYIHATGPVNFMYLDSPNTTSQTNYHIEAACYAGNQTVQVNAVSGYDMNSSVTVMEIAA